MTRFSINLKAEKLLVSMVVLLFSVLWLPRLDIYIAKATGAPISAALPLIFAVLFAKRVVWTLGYSSVKPFFYLLLGFSFTAFFSIYANNDFGATSEYFSFLAFSVVTAGLTGFFSRPENLEASVRIFFVAGAVLALSVCLDVFQLVEFQREVSVGSRGAGFAENPNFAILGLLSSLFVTQHSSSAALRLTSVWLFIPTAVLTGSRFGFIIAGIFLFSQVVDYRRPVRSALGFFIAIGLITYSISLVLPLLINTSSLYRRLTFTDISLFSADDGRVHVIRDYINDQTFYLFGHGLSYASAIGHRAHNSFVNYFFDLGLFPGLFFSAFYLSLVATLLKRRERFSAFVPLLSFVVLCPFFNNSLLTVKALVMLIAFLLARSADIRKAQVRAPT